MKTTVFAVPEARVVAVAPLKVTIRPVFPDVISSTLNVTVFEFVVIVFGTVRFESVRISNVPFVNAIVPAAGKALPPIARNVPMLLTFNPPL